jgi:hypothetical protein
MTTKQSWEDDMRFASCPVEIKDPFWWRWTDEAKEIIGEYIKQTLAEQAREIIKKCSEIKKEQLDKNDPDNYGACYAIGGFNDCLSKLADYITNTYL